MRRPCNARSGFAKRGGAERSGPGGGTRGPRAQSLGQPVLEAPTVLVLPPSPEELALGETATLTCLATRFNPKDILVTWTQQDRSVPAGSFTVFGPEEDGDGYTVYSKLSIPAEEWQRGDSFACVVGHEGNPVTFVPPRPTRCG
uniref:Ig-like domain-containing protein n=1 Tax=Dromaius novaehollandiae TaxID=8790 RepID=A0A8C4IXI2_DRONO